MTKSKNTGFIYECKSCNSRVQVYINDANGFTVLCRHCGHPMQLTENIKHRLNLIAASLRMKEAKIHVAATSD